MSMIEVSSKWNNVNSKYGLGMSILVVILVLVIAVPILAGLLSYYSLPLYFFVKWFIVPRFAFDITLVEAIATSMTVAYLTKRYSRKATFWRSVTRTALALLILWILTWFI